jgi:hypothetical protein
MRKFHIFLILTDGILFLLPIDRDALEPSSWEELAPFTYRLFQDDTSAAR